MSRHDSDASRSFDRRGDAELSEWTLPDITALKAPDDPTERAAARAQLMASWTGEIPVLAASARSGRHFYPADPNSVENHSIDNHSTENHSIGNDADSLIPAPRQPIDPANAIGRSTARPPLAPQSAPRLTTAEASPDGRRRRRADDTPAALVLAAALVSTSGRAARRRAAELDLDDQPDPDPGPGAEAPTDTVPPALAGDSGAGRFRRPALIGVAAIVCLLTAGAGTVAAMGKSVTISVDGQQHEVSTLSGDVAGALASAGISVGAHDTLAPAGGTAISDGSRISVQRGRILTLVVDGRERRIWTTATTVEQALSELGDADSRLVLSADRSRPIPIGGLEVSATTQRTVTLRTVTPRTVTPQDATRSAKDTAADRTAGDLLSQQKVALRAQDSVQPARSTPLADGMKVTITRRAVAPSILRQPIPQPTAASAPDPTLDKGKTRVVPGHAGVVEITYQITTVNGVAAGRTDLSRIILTPATPTVTYVGTKVVKFEDTWHVPWDQMAECESTSRWSVDTGNGTYGGLQFETSTWLAYGGDQFAARADLATKDQQIIVAERLYAKEGLAPWHCARLLGWGFGAYSGPLPYSTATAGW